MRQPVTMPVAEAVAVAFAVGVPDCVPVSVGLALKLAVDVVDGDTPAGSERVAVCVVVPVDVALKDVERVAVPVSVRLPVAVFVSDVEGVTDGVIEGEQRRMSGCLAAFVSTMLAMSVELPSSTRRVVPTARVSQPPPDQHVAI